MVFRLFCGYGEGQSIAESAISIRGLAYRYRGQEKPALDGVDLEVVEGEFVVVMRSSGAGGMRGLPPPPQEELSVG